MSDTTPRRNHDILLKEIDLIQACINRMASNSFLLKGWCISILGVILVLTRHNIDGYVYLILLFEILCFWWLDAYFLKIERMYRKLYDWVIVNRPQSDASMFDLNPHRFSGEVAGLLRVMLSKTQVVFYGIPFLVVFALLTGYMLFDMVLL